jgi:prepilin-type N-terminal cleavage/methylation domain-containing protein
MQREDAMIRFNRPARRRHAGFSLIELMIAMVLGIILTAGVVTLFVHSRQSFSQDENVARMQDEGRFALQEIARDLQMAGYVGEPLLPVAISLDPTLAIDEDCGDPAQANWIYNLTDTVTGEINTLTSVDNADGAAAAGAFSCVDAGEIVVDTDLVGVKRIAGNALAPANVEPGNVYLRSNNALGIFYQDPPSVTPVPAPFNDWEYRPRIYFIRNWSNVEGDGIPSLCRKILVGGGTPTMTTECVAQGIEDLQVEYGLDTNDDGSANRYLTNPTLAELQQAVSARVYLRARTLVEDRRYTDNRTYTVSNAPAVTPGDNFHRRVYSTTVTIHNLRNIQRLGI